MVDILTLWLPILIASVIVFIVSAVIHMVLPYHKSDFRKLPDEDATLDALGKLSIPPGDYMFPSTGGDMALMKSEEFKDKMRKGPVGMLTVFPPVSGDNPSGMGVQLTQWFFYCVIVSIFAAYVAGRALGPGAEYLQVHRFAGCTAFVAYALADWQRSIWYKQPWSTTLKNTFDGLIYGLLTGGTFGWLWPS
jgi:hypothetical protein